MPHSHPASLRFPLYICVVDLQYKLSIIKITKMKILKKVLIVIAILVAIPLVAAIFITKDYAVERSVNISKPVHHVYDYLKHLKNQDHYNVWVRMDPGMEKKYTGTDGSIGFISAWDSKDDNVGKGEQEIVKLAE